MTYFSDYSPYAYGRGSRPGVVHVGWLDNIHPYPKGAVDARLIEKMKLLASKPVELYRGKHICELCSEPPDIVKTTLSNGVIDPNCSWARWINQRSSNGEIRTSYAGITFAAPVLIVHYIEAHNYLPPTQFLNAVEAALVPRNVGTNTQNPESMGVNEMLQQRRTGEHSVAKRNRIEIRVGRTVHRKSPQQHQRT